MPPSAYTLFLNYLSTRQKEKSVKLYTLPASPYGARVAMQIAIKDLKIPIEASPWPLHSADFNQRFALRKLPILILDDGSSIGDSWAILEYLEALHPGSKALRPSEPTDIADMYLLARYADTHLAPQGTFPIFQTQLVPGSGSPQDHLPALLSELEKGERLIEQLPLYSSRELHLGDLALAPILLYATELLERFDGEHSIENYPLLNGWYSWVNKLPAASKVLDQLQSTVSAFFDQLKK